MAREPGITQDQVSKAAETIRAAGGRPTARAIREALGTGSMATVLKFFQAWQDAQVRPAEAPVSLPPALQRGLVDFVAEEVERNRSELLAELELARQANGDLIAEVERVMLMVQNLEATLEAAMGDRAELSGRLAQVEAERDAARHDAITERQAAEAARTEQAKDRLRLEAMPRLEKELDTLRQQLDQARREGAAAVDAERAGRVSAEQAAAVALARLEGVIDARGIVEGALAESREREQEREAEVSALRAELTAIRASIAGGARKRVPLSVHGREKKNG
ncbi:DNA-binding protein [Paraburkholderia sp. Ac-20347]|uniref:DNA-binding protein n=1 Tax=Paraburkholderia sp. Ac-20347 TaxID=2703892 RepID=UPI001980A241|nr:DNA-binding protein [Paraburkholderia sp. Ac-20347]MBN3813422.1 mucin-associated surface protein [Paraburkholderia sp. Ac-20347]